MTFFTRQKKSLTPFLTFMVFAWGRTDAGRTRTEPGGDGMEAGRWKEGVGGAGGRTQRRLKPTYPGDPLAKKPRPHKKRGTSVTHPRPC